MSMPEGPLVSESPPRASSPVGRILNIPSTDVPSVTDLRREINIGTDVDLNAFNAAVVPFLSTFTSDAGILGYHHTMWSRHDHAKGLMEMADEFLDKRGFGARFWPDRPDDTDGPRYQYSHDIIHIKTTMIQLFFKLSQQHKNKLRKTSTATGNNREASECSNQSPTSQHHAFGNDSHLYTSHSFDLPVSPEAQQLSAIGGGLESTMDDVETRADETGCAATASRLSKAAGKRPMSFDDAGEASGQRDISRAEQDGTPGSTDSPDTSRYDYRRFSERLSKKGDRPGFASADQIRELDASLAEAPVTPSTSNRPQKRARNVPNNRPRPTGYRSARETTTEPLNTVESLSGGLNIHDYSVDMAEAASPQIDREGQDATAEPQPLQRGTDDILGATDGQNQVSNGGEHYDDLILFIVSTSGNDMVEWEPSGVFWNMTLQQLIEELPLGENVAGLHLGLSTLGRTRKVTVRRGEEDKNTMRMAWLKAQHNELCREAGREGMPLSSMSLLNISPIAGSVEEIAAGM